MSQDVTITTEKLLQRIGLYQVSAEVMQNTIAQVTRERDEARKELADLKKTKLELVEKQG